MLVERAERIIEDLLAHASVAEWVVALKRAFPLDLALWNAPSSSSKERLTGPGMR